MGPEFSCQRCPTSLTLHRWRPAPPLLPRSSPLEVPLPALGSQNGWPRMEDSAHLAAEGNTWPVETEFPKFTNKIDMKSGEQNLEKTWENTQIQVTLEAKSSNCQETVPAVTLSITDLLGLHFLRHHGGGLRSFEPYSCRQSACRRSWDFWLDMSWYSASNVEPWTAASRLRGSVRCQCAGLTSSTHQEKVAIVSSWFILLFMFVYVCFSWKLAYCWISHVGLVWFIMFYPWKNRF